MINLCLVVIATQFSETKKRETERMMQERKRFTSSSTLASNSEPGGCYEEILKYVSHLWRRARRKFQRLVKHVQGRRQRKVTPERAISLRRKRKKKKGTSLHMHHHHHHHHHIHISNEKADTIIHAPFASPEVSDIDLTHSPRRPHQLMVPLEFRGDPSNESLATINYLVGSQDPNLLKVPSSASPNHLLAPSSRSGSFHSSSGGSSRNLALPVAPPDLLKHAASNSNVEGARNKLSPYGGRLCRALRSNLSWRPSGTSTRLSSPLDTAETRLPPWLHQPLLLAKDAEQMCCKQFFSSFQNLHVPLSINVCYYHFDSLVEDCGISSVVLIEIPQFWTKPAICSLSIE